jgi:hypothetical protein
VLSVLQIIVCLYLSVIALSVLLQFTTSYYRLVSSNFLNKCGCILYLIKKTYSHVDNICRIKSCNKEEKFGPIILAYVKPPFCY